MRRPEQRAARAAQPLTTQFTRREALVEPWTGFTYSPNWADFRADRVAGAFLKDPHGFVRLRGLVARTPSPPPLFEIITNLPVGYRPAKGLGFLQLTSGGSCEIDISANGDVQWAGPSYSLLISLDGIFFDTR